MSALAPWRLGRFEELGRHRLDEVDGASALVQSIGARLGRFEHDGWEGDFTSDARKDAAVAGMWARWFTGDPWGVRTDWDRLFLPTCEAVFRGVLRSRSVPNDAWSRCIDDLREGAVAAVETLPAEQGGHVVDLVADPDPGHQRWAVALMPPELEIDWSADDPWGPLRQGLLRGTVPVRAVDMHVQER